MRTSIWDYVCSSLWIGLNAALGVAVAAWGARYTRAALGDYHVLADVAVFAAAYAFFTGLSIRVLLRVHPFREGVYPMEGRVFFVWKIYNALNEMGNTVFLPFVPIFFRPLFFRFFGARVGKGVSVAGRFMEPHMIVAQDYAFFGGETIVTGHALTFDRLILKRVVVGERATVGVGAILMPGVRVGRDAIVAAGSVVPMDTVIPDGEIWGGVPARKIGEVRR